MISNKEKLSGRNNISPCSADKMGQRVHEIVKSVTKYVTRHPVSDHPSVSFPLRRLRQMTGKSLNGPCEIKIGINICESLDRSVLFYLVSESTRETK